MKTITNKALKIAIQGYAGSFHQQAAEQYYHQPVEIIACPSFTAMVQATCDPMVCDEGVMAIENSIAGSILTNYQLLEEAGLSIVGEVYIQIGQHLMALPGTQFKDIKEVHSHPMALLQCRKFFRSHPHIKLMETEDTALSAKNIQENKSNGVAAVAGELAAQIYDLEIVEKHIETVRNNYTRFLILSRDPDQGEWPHCNKASLHFNLKHKPGSLVEALQLIASEGVNLSKIQSVPVIEKEWQYSFHLDLEFEHFSSFTAVTDKLKPISESLKILGVYKNGKA
ncbi:MAG: prephenate dehydratase [Fulvivirga sp.]|nr:prephenate dehydratase [Fulvivirga sp.]